MSEVVAKTGVLSLVSFTVTIIDCSEVNTPSVTETTAIYDDCVSKSAPLVQQSLEHLLDDISISDPVIITIGIRCSYLTNGNFIFINIKT